MSDFQKEEPDRETAADDKESGPGLVELLEEIIENAKRKVLDGLTYPDVEFDPKTEPVTMNEDAYDHSTMPCTLSKNLQYLYPGFTVVEFLVNSD